MKGIELARRWFGETGLPALEKACPELLPLLAFGLAGHGSECFGFDDELSRDHDFSAAFSIWISERDEARVGYQLARVWQDFLKHNPVPVNSDESLCAESERGISTIEDFFTRHIGIPGAPTHWREWLNIPEYAFAEATNGEVFLDAPGVFTALRQEILTGMPEDVRLKKLAARLALMAQTGQYNVPRSLAHGERGAAALAMAEFVKNAISCIFLLNRRFAPYYKWSFRALRLLPELSSLAEPLEFLLTEASSESMRAELVESICGEIAKTLRTQGLSSAEETYLEPHALALMKKIENREIRTLHIMEG